MRTIRPAKIDDAERIAELLLQLGYEASSKRVHEKLLKFSENPSDQVLVATNGGDEVVGLISLHTLEMFHSEGRLGRITSLVVDFKHRGNGIGSLLVQEADKYLIERGCVRTEVTSGDHRFEAHAFYQTQAFVPGEKRFVKHYRLTSHPTSPPSVAECCATNPRSAG